MPHQVPFRQPAVTVPLSWGFAGPSQSFAQPVPLLKKDQLLFCSSLRTRKRGQSDDMDQESQPTPHRVISSCPVKRVKKALNTGTSVITDAEMLCDASRDENEEQVDLGKAFSESRVHSQSFFWPHQPLPKATRVIFDLNFWSRYVGSLTKPELLTLLQGIITCHPDLKPSISSLLPKPTLEAMSTKLVEVESQLLEVIPSKSFNRDEYVWNRVRLPLHLYVNECLSLLKLWSKAEDGFEQAQIHTTISNQFSFLCLLTTSIRKVEVSLPASPDGPDTLNSTASQPLRSLLIPDLLQAWNQFIEKIYHITSVNGIVLSEAAIEKWYTQLKDLANDTSYYGEGTRFMEPIRDLAKYRFGDIVRTKRLASHSNTQMNFHNHPSPWGYPSTSSSACLVARVHTPNSQPHDRMIWSSQNKFLEGNSNGRTLGWIGL